MIRHKIGIKMAIVRIVRREKENKDGSSPLYVVFNINREKIRIPVKISVKSSEWDSENESIKGRSKEIRDKNLIISNARSRISDVFVCARLKNEQLTKERFFKRYNNPSDFQTFYDFTASHLRQTKVAISINTYRQHLSVIKKLRTYAPDLSFTVTAISIRHL